jgi:hypothetical protein
MIVNAPRSSGVTAAGTPLSRKAVDFSDAERDLLNDARPFLIQGSRNALEHTRLKSDLDIPLPRPPAAAAR